MIIYVSISLHFIYQCDSVLHVLPHPFMTSPETTAPAHTPGPWKAELSQDGIYWEIQGRPESGLNVAIIPMAVVGETDVEREANARLIAAAPDLLEACKQLLTFCDDLDDAGPRGEGWQSDKLLKALANANAAISQAESSSL